MARYNYFQDDPNEKSFSNKTTSDNENANTNVNNTSMEERFNDIKNRVFSSLEHLPKAINHNSTALSGINKKLQSKYYLLKFTAVLLFFITLIIMVFSFNHTISRQNLQNDKYYADAGKVCTSYIVKYGATKWELLSSDSYGEHNARVTGLCYVRQMDFDGNGKDELMLCYNDSSSYALEVWGYHKKEFKRLYSDTANCTKSTKDGSWISFFYKDNTYYICKSEPDSPEKVSLLKLKRGEFKTAGEFDYDYKNNIYSLDGKINANNFETIKLSCIKPSRAEYITEIVINNLSSFNTISLNDLEAKKTNKELMLDAYLDIVNDRISKYKNAKIVNKTDSYIDGVSVVKLIDFNNDKKDELLIAYRKTIKVSNKNPYSSYYDEMTFIEKPVYNIEIYSWNGAIAKRIFNKEGLSSYFNDSSTNYILIKNNSKSKQLCFNDYSFEDKSTYNAASSLYSMKNEKLVLSESSRLRDSWGYKSYYIDNEYVYKSTFEEKAFKAPKFLNDGEKINESNYSIIYTSGNNINNELQKTINDTQKTIKALNSSINP